MKRASAGVVHGLPKDLEKVLTEDKDMLKIWEDLTPLGRNEFICWIKSAKKRKQEIRGSI
jgi:uncharacterized protein YdeI (YjbR/CyaY-like superfamily)